MTGESFESAELAGLARQYGARREYRDGIGCWRFPPYYCRFCVPLAGPDTLPLPGCPEPLARHGPIEE